MSTLDQRPGCPQPNLHLHFLQIPGLSWLKPDDPKADSVSGERHTFGSDMLPICSDRVAMWFTPNMHVELM